MDGEDDYDNYFDDDWTWNSDRKQGLGYFILPLQQGSVLSGGGGMGTLGFWGGDVPLGPWNTWSLPGLVQLNFATLHWTKLPKPPLPSSWSSF